MPLPMMRKEWVPMLLSYHPLSCCLPRVPSQYASSSEPHRPNTPSRSAAGISATLGATLDDVRFPARRLVISSPTVWRLHGGRFESLSAEEPILIPDGERFKTLATVAKIYDALVKAQADRGAGIVAIGGGVVGDVAGFAAATFLRGLPVAHVPTTLLAQVDSSIGGKTGVNHPLRQEPDRRVSPAGRGDRGSRGAQ